MNPNLFTHLETVTNIIEAVVTITAVIFGGVSAYAAFIRNRLIYPRAKLEHKTSCRRVTEDKVLLSVDVFLSNTGDVLITLTDPEISVKQVLPPEVELQRYVDAVYHMPDTGAEIIEWHVLAAPRVEWDDGQLEVEPGERHQFHHDFLINADVRTVMVESYFHNLKKRGRSIGWGLVTIHDLYERRGINNANGTTPQIRSRTQTSLER